MKRSGVVLLAVVIAGLAGAVPAAASTATAEPPAEFRPGVAAISATQGRVEYKWTYDQTATFSVAEVVGGTLVPRSGATAEGWSSDSETPGRHTFRVTRTLGGESAWLDHTLTVPTRNLLGTQSVYLASAVQVPATNANGATLAGRVSGAVTVSPDRRTLAAPVVGATFVSIWLLDTTGRPIRQLTDAGWDTDPAFSPDGTRIAFVHRDTDGGTPSIAVVSATVAGSAPLAVSGTSGMRSPAWTPDGGGLVLEVGDHTTSEPAADPLVLVRLASSQQTELAGTAGGYEPAVSRTGRVAYAQRSATTPSGVWVTDLAGAEPVRWSPAPVQDRNWASPAWDPQGVTLALVTAVNGSSSGPSPWTLTRPGEQPESWSPANPYYGIYHLAWVDAMDAAPTLTVNAPAVTRATSTSVTISVADADDMIGGLAVTCRIDTAAWTPCQPGTWSVPTQRPGTHTLSVKVTDPAGKTATVSRGWTIDQTGPAVSMRTPSQPFTPASSIPVSWTGTDQAAGVASYQVRWTRAAYSGGFGAWQYPAAWQKLTSTSVVLTGAVPAYDYCFQTRAVDKVGNTGNWSSQRCSAVALDDRALTTSAGWSRVAWSQFYRSTATTTTRAGATLSRSGSALIRVAVVATRCPSCGTVGVYVNGRSVGTVNLYSSTTRRQAITALPAFSYRTGTVTIKVLTSGKLVQIDGLGISRT